MTSTKPRVTLIAAVARNGVIGADNEMPWHVPEDLKFFKQMTLGKPLIMGRKTFQAIGRPLPGRTTLIVSRDPSFMVDSTETCISLDAALDRGREIAQRDDADAIMVAGGGNIYAQALVHADRLIITHLDLAPQGDTMFPVAFDEEYRISPSSRPDVMAFIAHPIVLHGPANPLIRRYCQYDREQTA